MAELQRPTISTIHHNNGTVRFATADHVNAIVPASLLPRLELVDDIQYIKDGRSSDHGDFPVDVQEGAAAETGPVVHPHGDNAVAHAHAEAVSESGSPCTHGRIPFERPGMGDTVCVYPETVERLKARGPW